MIGVVIPVYNGQRFLRATLDSVLRQTCADWALVVVDDGSTDRSAAIVEEYAQADARIRLVRQENAGVSAARNRGFDETAPTAEFVAFLDADDVWEPDALEFLLAAARSSPSAPAVYGLARAIEADGQAVKGDALERHQRERFGVTPRGLSAWPPTHSTDFAVEVYRDVITTLGTVLFRRDSLLRSGLFDPELRCWEDWDLYLRMCRIGAFEFNDRLVLSKRSHDLNLSSNRSAMTSGARRVRRKLLEQVRGDKDLFSLAMLGQRLLHRANSQRELSMAWRTLSEGQPLGAAHHVAHAAVSRFKDIALGLVAFVQVSRLWTHCFQAFTTRSR